MPSSPHVPYTFSDKGVRSLTLRPELTAGLVRAVISHRLYAGQLPVKLYTVGANFRYERTQAGRYRPVGRQVSVPLADLVTTVKEKLL